MTNTAHSETAGGASEKSILLSQLREPPTVGQFYMVPVVRYPWRAVWAEWPVLGPLHSDADFFNFPRPHYHVDARFVAPSLARRLPSDFGDPFSAAQRFPLCNTGVVLPSGMPRLARRRCVTADFPYRHDDKSAVRELRAAKGEPHAITLADGRQLCPHRKVDLSTIAPDDDGLTTCPLHGLRVRCTPPKESTHDR